MVLNKCVCISLSACFLGEEEVNKEAPLSPNKVKPERRVEC